MAKLDDLVDKAISPGLPVKGQKAKRAALARAHHIVLKHYHRQQGGDGNYSSGEADKLLTDLEEKDDFQLKAEHAEAAAHELTAEALKKAIPTVANTYKNLIKQYAEETDPEKKKELLKQLDAYKGMGAKVGIDPEELENLKKTGYTPDGLNSLFENVDRAVQGLDRKAFLDQIPEDVAYDEVYKLSRKHSKLHHGKKFNPESVKAAGADAAKSVISLDREAKGNDEAFYEGAKRFYLKPRKKAA